MEKMDDEKEIVTRQYVNINTMLTYLTASPAPTDQLGIEALQKLPEIEVGAWMHQERMRIRRGQFAQDHGGWQEAVRRTEWESADHGG